MRPFVPTLGTPGIGGTVRATYLLPYREVASAALPSW